MKRTIEFHRSIKYNKTSKDMNENINLTKILKDCPRGFKLYSAVHGEVKFQCITDSIYPISVIYHSNNGGAYDARFTKEGFLNVYYNGECLLVPSKNNQDWSKFKAPWLKKPKFDPKTLQPFDKVLISYIDQEWTCGFYSHYKNPSFYPYKFVIPYNDETKHLIGTTEEAPEYYRYWED